MKHFIQAPVVWLMTGIITGWAHFAPLLLANVVWVMTMAGLLACVMRVAMKRDGGDAPAEPADVE